jgi:hypothetical protein
MEDMVCFFDLKKKPIAHLRDGRRPCFIKSELASQREEMIGDINERYDRVGGDGEDSIPARLS